ncbi:MAG: hypothetical protein O2816_08420 [Planctomycetota bacterium]|nr:hypothetical protein [Planctomycetota bacterium]
MIGALLLALAGQVRAPQDGLVPPADRVSQPSIDAAIDGAVEWILAHQEVDGGWLYGRKQRMGHTALAVYTLLEAGLDPEHHAVQRALLFLHGKQAGTYDTALLIMALVEHDRRGNFDRIERLARQLLSWQHGDFGYPSGADLSNTQFAAMGLRAATLAGVQIPDEAWCALAEAALEYAQQDGGFGYHKAHEHSRDARGSMTTAGVAVLSICRSQLVEEGERYAPACYRALSARVDAAIAGGLAWMTARFSVTMNPGWGTNRVAYYLYGLERMGALAEVRTLGEIDWYHSGARVLVGQQHADGHWQPLFGRKGVQETCYGVLFLTRATAPRSGVAGAGSARMVHGQAEAIQVAVAGDTPLRLWITGYGETLPARFLHPGEQTPRVARVVYTAGGQEIGRRLGSSSQPAKRDRFLVTASLDRPGEHEIVAELHLVPADGGATEVVRSTPLVVEVNQVLAEWMRAGALDPRFNLLAGAGVEVSASSQVGDRLDPLKAVDQIQSTAWVAEGTDELPTLTLRLTSPVTADTLVLSHAREVPLDKTNFARALEVQVRINGGDPLRLRMPADIRDKARLQLPGRVPIELLELSIPWRAPTENGDRAVGFAEIELQDSTKH